MATISWLVLLLFGLLIIMLVLVTLRLFGRSADRENEAPADQRLAELWHKLEQTERRLAALEKKLAQTRAE